MKYIANKPVVAKSGVVNDLMHTQCPYCSRAMDYIGTENAVRKRLLKQGKKDIVNELQMKKGSKNYVFTCPSDTCGGIFIRDHLIIGNENTQFVPPGFYHEDPITK